MSESTTRALTQVFLILIYHQSPRRDTDLTLISLVSSIFRILTVGHTHANHELPRSRRCGLAYWPSYRSDRYIQAGLITRRVVSGQEMIADL